MALGMIAHDDVQRRDMRVDHRRHLAAAELVRPGEDRRHDLAVESVRRGGPGGDELRHRVGERVARQNLGDGTIGATDRLFIEGGAAEFDEPRLWWRLDVARFRCRRDRSLLSPVLEPGHVPGFMSGAARRPEITVGAHEGTWVIDDRTKPREDRRTGRRLDQIFMHPGILRLDDPLLLGMRSQHDDRQERIVRRRVAETRLSARTKRLSRCNSPRSRAE